jgi:hypothetical protein
MRQILPGLSSTECLGQRPHANLIALHGQRPFTVSEPLPSGTARPSGANIPIVQMSGFTSSSLAATPGSSQARNTGLQPISVVHPADPSA